MSKIVFAVLKHVFRFMIYARLHWPLVCFYAHVLERMKPENGAPFDPSKPILLALNVFHFGKDLEMLANSGEFNVFSLPPKWQGALLNLYWTDWTWSGSEDDPGKADRAYYQPADPKMIKMQKKLRGAMGIFLGSLFRKTKIDAVASADFTCRDEYEYCMACRKLGMPYIVFYNEPKGVENSWNNRMEDMGKFRGSLIILHNENMKDMILKAGFATVEQLVVLDCPGISDALSGGRVSPPEAKNAGKYINCVKETIALHKKEKFNNPFYVTALNKITKYTIRYMTAVGLYWPLAYIYSKMSLQKVPPADGKPDSSKPWILGIKSQYFMSDLNILADSKEFNVYKITNQMQSLILRVYWDDEAWKDGEKSYYHSATPEIAEYQEKLRGFLRKFLGAFYRINKIKCVIVANVSYKDCYDWGVATREAGVPYVVLQRENLFACPGLVRLWYNKTKDLGKFHGSSVVLHNSKVREIYLKSGYSTDEQTAVLGCMRMDGYLKKIKEHDFEHEKKHNRAVLFSFHHISLLETMYDEYFNPNIGYAKFFENVHVTFAKTALANPEKEFVIKPRSPNAFYTQIRKALERNGLDMDKIPNLTMSANLNPHDLILNSDVVCAFASTVILEAAIARRPVIIPYFDETLKPEYQDFILFKDYFSYFDIADSRENLQSLIEKRLENPAVSEEYVKKMGELFEQYVSSFDAKSTLRYINYLTDVIKNCKR